MHFCFVTGVGLDEKKQEPLTFQEAWWHPDLIERKKWHAAIKKEFRQMLKLGVWKRGGGTNVLPKGRKGIGMKRVFKIKKSDIYRARLVAKGYDQIAGVDFKYNFAPVLNDASMRIMFVIWLLKTFHAELCDVQMVFLHGGLAEEIFIEIPPGYVEFLKEEFDEDVDFQFQKLEKALYGLVQAVRSWFLRFSEVLKKRLGFESFPNEKCLFKRENEDGFVMIGMYVGDCLVIGDKPAVKKAIEDIEKVFQITKSEMVNEFVGCTIEKQEGRILLSQPDLIRKLLQKFEEKIKSLKKYMTPAPANTHVVVPTMEEEKLSEEEQKKYRSGVGSLLYLLKHSRPDLSNAVRDLSKTMMGANKAQQKLMYRAIKFVEATKDYKLVLEKPEAGETKWSMKAFCDSDFAGDTETRKSISGYIIYLKGIPVVWKSKGQRSVSLSSTEAAYMAILEVMAEILFVKSVLEFLKVECKFPIQVQVDNVGAIYLAKQAVTSNRTKHIDTRYHFVRDYVEDGVVKVQFIWSEENDADIFTKNLQEETYWRHAEKFIQNCD